MTALRAVPDVNILLAEPERVHKLEPVDARTLAIQLASLLVALAVRGSESSVAAVSNETSPAVWLSAEQVEQRYGLTNAWLMEHRRLLASLGIVSRPSRKIRLYDPRKLSRFLESRRVTNKDVDLGR